MSTGATVSVAVVLVASPALLVTTTVNTAPLSPLAVAGYAVSAGCCSINHGVTFPPLVCQCLRSRCCYREAGSLACKNRLGRWLGGNDRCHRNGQAGIVAGGCAHTIAYLYRIHRATVCQAGGRCGVAAGGGTVNVRAALSSTGNARARFLLLAPRNWRFGLR